MIASLNRAALVRIAPFAAFVALLALRGVAPADGAWGFDPRWLYGVTVLVTGTLLLAFRAEYGELARQTLPSWREALLAATIGAAVYWSWINLDAPWMRLTEATAGYRPVDDQGEIIWSMVMQRWIGAALLVPLMEELFWRSFLMRWIVSARFEAVLPARVGLRALLLSTFLFMLGHTLWLAAILAGLAYAGLYIRTGRLWTAVIAHAVTNGLLGVWVVLTGNWGFW